MQAETDSDEVYAQIMLQPEADVSRLSYLFFFWDVASSSACQLYLCLQICFFSHL